MGIYISSLTSIKTDEAIEGLLRMSPQIVVTNATPNSQVNCKCTAINYNVTLTADENGSCAFNIPEYGDYIINNTIEQPFYEYKRLTISI